MTHQRIPDDPSLSRPVGPPSLGHRTLPAGASRHQAEAATARRPKRQALLAQFEFKTWIADAARRARQIQAVTHALKATHPDARGTSLYRPPAELAQHPLVGNQCLAEDFAGDVVGNAAALDVYKFLRVAHDSRTLLDWCWPATPTCSLR